MKHAGYSNIVLVCVYVCVCVITSCQPDTTCRENLTVGLISELREIYYDQNHQPQLCTVWDSITVQGIGSSDTLYNNTKYAKKLLLPLHTNADTTQYTLTYHGEADTITVCHTNAQNFVSVECGCVVDHEIISIDHTTHWIDTIEIIQTAIHRQGESNLYIWHER